MSLGMQEILPDGGLASFQNHVSKLADLGRYEDAYIVHAAEGETVVPMAVFDENPRLKAMLFAQMRDMGIDPERYIVGNELNSINPVTGQPEFFLKKIFKEAKKAVKKIAPYAGVIAAGFGAPWQAATGIGALGGLYGEGDIGGAIKGGLYGYGASKLLGEQGLYGQLPGGTEKGWLPGMRAGGKGIFAQSKEIADNKKEMLRLKTEGLEIADNKKFYDDLKEANKVLLEEGRFPNLSALPWYEQGALGLGATFGATDLLAMGEEDKDGDGYPDDWWDIQPKHPWGGNFAAPGVDYSANGGIINTYDDGGPVNDDITGTGIFSPGGTEFVDRRKGDFNPEDYIGSYIMVMQNSNPKSNRETLKQQYYNWFNLDPTTEEYQDRKNRLLRHLSHLPGNGYGHSMAEELFGAENEGKNFYWYSRNSGLTHKFEDELKEREEVNPPLDDGGKQYTEDKYADGGIAHLAGGSFPRMTGAISGPGGPRDDMVPAMLSDGEFVMTADAVRNAGGGDRREGARRMYQLMNQLQGVA